jgi:tetratricopeptide (TPR) repeat protein
MALNKAKVLKAAEKYVIQGKINHAIAEYQKVIKEDPTDLPLVNTLGDLYVRIGNVPEAVKSFTRLAESYDNGGFVVRAIAMYKKVCKTDPAQTNSLIRLADLYVRQGLMSDARFHYLQAAEVLLRKGSLKEAVATFTKTVEVDPENPAIDGRLAEVLLKLGQNGEALRAWHSAALKSQKKGSLAEAENYLKRAMELNESDVQAALTFATVINELGRTDEALSCLDKIQFHEFNPEIMEGRFRILLKAGRLNEASKTADHLMELDSQSYKLQLMLAQAFAERQDPDRATRLVENVFDVVLERGEGEAVENQLKSILQQDPDHIPTLLVMIRYYSAVNLTHNLPSLLEKVGNIYLRNEQIAEAASIYSQLARLEPDNPSHRETLKHIKGRLGSEGAEIELPRLVPDMSSIAERFVTEPTLRTITPDSSGDTAVSDTAEEATYSPEQVQSFMVEGDLFASYGLFRKAIEQYKRILEWIPHHIEVHEKIRDMFAKVGDLPQAAQECLTLASIYTARGDSESANRNFALAYQYDPNLHQQPIYHEEVTTAPPEVGPPSGSKPEPSPDQERTKGLLEEFDFYIEQGFFPEAKRCLDEYLRLDPVSLEGRQRLERYQLRTSGQEMPKAGETAPEEAGRTAEFAEEISFEEFEGEGVTGAKEKVSGEGVAEIEPVAPTAVPVETATSSEVKREEEVVAPPAPFADIMGHLNAELAGSALEKPAYSVKSREEVGEVGHPGGSADNSSLAEVFAEFKEGLEDEDKEETDFETHYNLGIAFKEMGLLEEAIAEFQKALKGQSPVEAAEEFVRCCNMLGLCFVEKGLPQVAIKWFTKGLESPGRDEETYQALRYDLGCAQEKAGNPKAALETFLDVYGVNVNYRDVAEKIAHLKKSMNG